MIIERVRPSGYWRIYATHEGQLISRVFIGYTKREAIAAFREEIR